MSALKHVLNNKFLGHSIGKKIVGTIFVMGFSLSTMAELVVEDGFVRKPIPGRTMTAAFMNIHNTSEKDVILTRATLEGAKTVEIHTHTHEEGVMRMRQIFELPIKAGESVTLEPGGLHLMVFGITQLPDNPTLELCTVDNECFSKTIIAKSLVNKHTHH